MVLLYIIICDMNKIDLTKRTKHLFFVPRRAPEFPRSRSTRGPPEPLRPPGEQPHPGTLRPAACPPPPLPQEIPSVKVPASEAVSPLSLWEGFHVCARKEGANFYASVSQSCRPPTEQRRPYRWRNCC